MSPHVYKVHGDVDANFVQINGSHYQIESRTWRLYADNFRVGTEFLILHHSPQAWAPAAITFHRIDISKESSQVRAA